MSLPKCDARIDARLMSRKAGIGAPDVVPDGVDGGYLPVLILSAGTIIQGKNSSGDTEYEVDVPSIMYPERQLLEKVFGRNVFKSLTAAIFYYKDHVRMLRDKYDNALKEAEKSTI